MSELSKKKSALKVRRESQNKYVHRAKSQSVKFELQEEKLEANKLKRQQTRGNAPLDLTLVRDSIEEELQDDDFFH